MQSKPTVVPEHPPCGVPTPWVGPLTPPPPSQYATPCSFWAAARMGLVVAAAGCTSRTTPRPTNELSMITAASTLVTAAAFDSRERMEPLQRMHRAGESPVHRTRVHAESRAV